MRTHLKNFRNLFFLLIAFSALGFNRPAKKQNKRVVVAGIAHVTDTGKTSVVIAPNATIKLISKDFGFSEGPASNKKGEVFFSDQPNDKIWKYGTDGKLSIFLDKTGRSNGMYF